MCMWQLKHCLHLSHLTYTHIGVHTQKHTHTHTHTHTHKRTHTHSLTLTQIKTLQIFEKIAKSNTRAIDTTLVHEI